MRIASLTPRFVDYIPDHLEAGILYISRPYQTAVHLCCCGCGQEVVTPLTPAGWRIHTDSDGVTLNPSIGNGGFACRSHYWVRRGQVVWASSMSPVAVERARSRDLADARSHAANVNRRKQSFNRDERIYIQPGISETTAFTRRWQRLLRYFLGK